MVEWNKAKLIGHLLRVVTRSNSLWPRWVNETILKNKHFWTLNIPTDYSWIWRKVLKLRCIAIQFVSYSIGTGNSVSLWFDPWWGGTYLAALYSSPIISQCGMHANDLVSKIICSGTWCLPAPNARHHHLDPLLQHWLNTFDFPAFNLNGLDSILWDGLVTSKVKTWNIWNSIRTRGDTVNWHGAIWHKLIINRLHRFGISESQQCFLCIGGRETDSHLFTRCPYSRWILIRLLLLVDLSVVGNTWIDLLQHLSALEDKLRGVLGLCLLQIFCYHLWRERNARAHNSGILGPSKLMDCITRDFIARLHGSIWFSKTFCNRVDLLSSLSPIFII
ncbi:uncharacterized protein LOC141719583 [Apium graveolens]|uniref:uncharacterized protein LOC141719583 n=1 Tax=Apium graveolens TaxID=4045 RepID=UPI003D7AB373